MAKFDKQQHNIIFDKLKQLVGSFDSKIKLENMTGKFNRLTQNKILNRIKNNDESLLVVCQKYPNEIIFQSRDKNVALFYKNRYIFFDSDINFQDVKMPIIRMINGDNAYNQCKICMENIKDTTMPCTTCGNLICFKCTFKILNDTNIDNNGILKCPLCQSNGIKFNRTEITV